MNEVWVPSEWQRETFVASGVDPKKIRVVPEGVNTTLWVLIAGGQSMLCRAACLGLLDAVSAHQGWDTMITEGRTC
jgi:hypothetical protein